MSKLIKLRQGLAVIVPDELSSKLGLKQGQEVIVKESKFGLFINPIKEKEGEKPVLAPAFGREEVELVNKLLSMKFSDRTPEYVNKQLNSSEKKILSGLIEKKAINVFKSQKYKEGVYNIKDKTYEMIREIQKQGKEKEVKEVAEKKIEKKEIEEAEEIEKDPLKRLEKKGYAVIEYESEAKRISEEIISKGKKREIIGIRGFDKKYYVLKSSFFIKSQPKIKNVLRAGKTTIDQISDETGLDKQACTGILALMNENGEVIEKRKGVFISSD